MRESKNIPDQEFSIADSAPLEHTVVIVDDDQYLSLSIKEKLFGFTEFNFIVETVNNPEVALKLLKQLQDEGISPSIIISDLSMPGMSGNEFLSRSMEYFPEAKKILMSGNPNLDAIVHSVNDAHIYRILTKPIQDFEFRSGIVQALEVHEKDIRLKEMNLRLQHINENLERIVEEKVYELSHKNRELLDSIHYAGLIQRSVLCSENDFTAQLKNAFTLVLPKDIVSGDFFWYSNDEENLSYCIADSTGHGVPGAFVSLLAFSALRESFESTKHKNDIYSIMQSANNQFKKALNLNTNKDSAELGYFHLNKQTLQIKFCGFKISLLVVRRHELIEIDGSKLVFGSEDMQYFNEEHVQTFQLQRGDSIFMSSDGFFDQFGGKNNKKFGSRRFKMLVTLVASHQTENHRSMLLKEFHDWKGNNEQTDDVSVFGLTV
jgi:phosphoserine phosphatase RsbU/P